MGFSLLLRDMFSKRSLVQALTFYLFFFLLFSFLYIFYYLYILRVLVWRTLARKWTTVERRERERERKREGLLGNAFRLDCSTGYTQRSITYIGVYIDDREEEKKKKKNGKRESERAFLGILNELHVYFSSLSFTAPRTKCIFRSTTSSPSPLTIRLYSILHHFIFL